MYKRSTLEGQPELAAKQATARLRLLAHLPADKAFFDAGEPLLCRPCLLVTWPMLEQDLAWLHIMKPVALPG